MAKPLAITIMGPTAAGKTDLAFALAKRLPVEVVSVDSALVYAGMDIGSAKPSREELAHVPHRLIDIRDPSAPYSVAEFCRDAVREIEDILANGRIPLLVGGTMMYFKALLEGLSDLPPANPELREAIENEAERHGWPHMHSLLCEVDPVSAEKIHPNHSQRLSRALEVFRLTGKPMSSFHGQLKGGVIDQYHWHQFSIAPRDRALLHARIAERFKKMLAAGLLGEVAALMARGDLHKELPAIRAVGYRQAWEHLSGDYDSAQLLEKGIAASRQLAKRQLTWLRSWPNLHRLHTQNSEGDLYSYEDLSESVLNIIGKSAL